jgi:hypothetical protein
MKGGSIASDSVLSNLDVKVFDKLNALFDNKVGGGKSGKRGGGCGCDKKTVVRKGGSAFGSMMGSTMEAFQGNVRSMPHEMFAGPNAGVVSAAMSANNASKKANTGIKAPNAGIKAPNAGIKSNASNGAKIVLPVLAANASGPKTNATAKPPTTTGGSRSSKTLKKGGNSQKFPTAAYSGEGGRCSKCGHRGGSDTTKIHRGGRDTTKIHRGGNQSSSIPLYPSNTSITNTGLTMSQLMANSRGVSIKNKKLHGGKDVPIGPNLNIWDVPSNLRPQVHSSVNDVLATEGISSSPQIQKFMNFGSPSEKFPQPFSYGQTPVTGGAKAWKKKLTKKVKAVRRKRV